MYQIKDSINQWFKKEFYKYRDNDPAFDDRREIYLIP